MKTEEIRMLDHCKRIIVVTPKFVRTVNSYTNFVNAARF